MDTRVCAIHTAQNKKTENIILLGKAKKMDTRVCAIHTAQNKKTENIILLGKAKKMDEAPKEQGIFEWRE